MDKKTDIKKNEKKKVSNKKEAKAEKKEAVKKPDAHNPNIKLFGKWNSVVEVTDPGLKPYMNLQPRILPKSSGVFRNRFHKSKMHIVERLALRFMIPGHTGKRHRITSGRFSGNYANCMKIVENALKIVEEKEKTNPILVLVKAIQNAAVREEIISFQMGSVMAREAVITSPQRRIDKTLRYISQGSYKKAFSKNKPIASVLAGEIINAYKNSSDSFAIKERERIENEASGSR